jgi:protein ImuB
VRLLNWPIDRLQRARWRDARRREEDLQFAICDLRLDSVANHKSQISNLKSEISNPKSQIANCKSQIANPLVLVRTIATRQIVIAANDAARAGGICPTMTLGEARALCATVEHEEHDPAQDAKSLEALARWMMRFSPTVALASDQGGIFLDLTGCERVFEGLENVIARIECALQKMRIAAKLAVAQTPGAAWAMTFENPKSESRNPKQIRMQKIRISNFDIVSDFDIRISNLPVLALRLESHLIESLHHLGLETIGQLLRLPRELLPARFGQVLTLRLDQLLGHVPEPLVPLEHVAMIRARMDFDGAVDSLEAVWIVFKKLIGQIVQELLRRGRGAREIELSFYRAYAQTIRTTVRLSRPSRDPVNLFNLLRCAFETIETDEGFLGIQLAVTSSQRISEEQIGLLGAEEFAGEIELSHLIERLCVRLGEEAVAQPELVESYMPERAFLYHGFSTRAGSATAARVENPCYLETLRPLHLLRRPVEIRVMVTPSDDREGLPVLFNHDADVHRIVHTVGPERIAGEWWQGHHKTRDYFDVEDEAGKRFWIFRVRESGKWFLHGEFE